MSTVDPEILAPLSKISDILLKRPGKISIESIKRLSSIYGFETFTDTLTVQNKFENGSDEKGLVYALSPHAGSPISGETNQPIVDRLSLSGKILLIDIDFLKGEVKDVSISSAINLQPIDDKTYNFLTGESQYESVNKILLRNLQNTTLDQFNKNLRILSQFDRLSPKPPNDLFNLFNELAYNLINIQEYEQSQVEARKSSIDADQCCPLTGDEAIAEAKLGYFGIGQMLMNQQNKIGLFLRYWEDNRFISRYLYDERKIETKESQIPYLIHFKITEDIHMEPSDLELDVVGERSNSDEKNTSTGSTTSPTNNTTSSNDGALKLKWFENGDWLINNHDTILNSNLRLLVLEACPKIWIPKDLLMELGISNYLLRSPDNDFFNNNQQEFHDKLLDGFYPQVNESHTVQLRNTTNHKIRVTYLLGCEMVKIFKISLPELSKIQPFMSYLRNWCLLNSLMRNLLSESTMDLGENEGINGGNVQGKKEDKNNDDAVRNEEKQDQENITGELHLEDITMNDDINSENNNGNNINNENNSWTVSVEDLQIDEISLSVAKGSKTTQFIIRNGLCYSNESQKAEILLQTGRITEIFKGM